MAHWNYLSERCLISVQRTLTISRALMAGAIECQLDSHGGTVVQEVTRQTKRRQAAELASVAEGLVHALRNPLFAVRLDLHTLRKMASGDQRGDQKSADVATVDSIVGECERQLDRAEEFLGELVAYACPSPPREQAIDLQQAVDIELERLRERASTPLPVNFLQERSEAIAVWMDPSRLQAILSALLELATASGGADVVSVKVKTRGDRAELCITNRQWSLSKRDRRRIFKPFATIEGMAPSLRLASAKRSVEEAGGKIACVAGSDGGTLLRVRLPRCSVSLEAKTSDDHGNVRRHSYR
jgi:signal transduction histidine kinase